MIKDNATLDELLKTRVIDTDLSVRTLNALKHSEVRTVHDLVMLPDKGLCLLRWANFGKHSYNEVKCFLKKHDLSFGMNIKYSSADFRYPIDLRHRGDGMSEYWDPDNLYEEDEKNLYHVLKIMENNNIHPRIGEFIRGNDIDYVIVEIIYHEDARIIFIDDWDPRHDYLDDMIEKGYTFNWR